MNKRVEATPENYLELMEALSSQEALNLARSIIFRLKELHEDDDTYWMEKPWKFPEYWVPALNGTLEDFDFDYLEEEEE